MKVEREHLKMRWDRGEEPTLAEFLAAVEHLDPQSRIIVNCSGQRCFVRIEEPV